jgi:site-specific recombinase XerD
LRASVAEAGFDHERFVIYVWRSVRANGDTKTEKSHRTLELPAQADEALRTHHARQARERLSAGKRWQHHGFVFARQAGTLLDASHVHTAFKTITKKARLGESWTPRELRHSFASIMSDNGVPHRDRR